MGKKQKHPEHENLERWLVSYADFITLLFAVFVVLYALSQLDLAKFKELKISLSRAFAPTIFTGDGAEPKPLPGQGENILNREDDEVNIIPGINPTLELKKMQKAEGEIKEAIEKGDLKGVSAKLDKRGLVISLVDSVFFASGSALVKSEANKMLDKIALTLKKDFAGNKIRIEGHTDSDPINTSIYPSNWELSGSRASSVVRHFIKRFKMPKQTFSAVGYADSVPIASNATIDGKRKNRRVEIVILNSKTADLEAGANGLASNGITPQTETTPKPEESNIRIIKGSDLEKQETKIHKQEQEAKEETTTQPDGYKPIEMPVQSKEKPKSNKPYEILDIETTTHH